MRPLLRLGIATGLLFLASISAFSVDIGAYFDLSRLDFARNRPSDASTLPGDAYIWGIAFSAQQELSDQFSLDLNFESDPVLRNVGYTLISYTDQYFSIRLGPYFGILNTTSSILQSGLSTTVRLYVPGVTALTLRSDNTLSGRLVVPGDYIQEESELSIGFFAPNVIPAAYVRSKRYTWQTEDGEAIDALTAYGLQADIFEKNVPYGVVLDFSYQDVKRSYVEEETTTHAYGALVLGTDLSVDLLERFSLLLDLETSLYTFGLDDLLGEVSGDEFLFRLRAGVSCSF